VEAEKAGGGEEGEGEQEDARVPSPTDRRPQRVGERGAGHAGREHEPEMGGLMAPVPIEARTGEQESENDEGEGEEADDRRARHSATVCERASALHWTSDQVGTPPHGRAAALKFGPRAKGRGAGGAENLRPIEREEHLTLHIGPTPDLVPRADERPVSPVRGHLEALHERLSRSAPDGAVASYIPELPGRTPRGSGSR